MACTITINLTDGQNVMLPFTVNGGVAGTAVPPNDPANITDVKRRIDGGSLTDPTTVNGLGTPTVTWTVALPGDLTTDADHTLTIVATDDQSAQPTSASVTFHVM